jgi:hypothetical protein
MKFGVKLIVIAVLALSVGVAFASPLLYDKLNIKPWIKHVQGPTADFNVDVVYANFTIIDGSKPVSTSDGPAISYYVVLNVTNLSDIGAVLRDVNFIAAGEISNTSTSFVMDTISGSGYEVEGAWVDGVWYNVTYVTGGYPTIDRDGNVVESPWGNSTWFKPYWMEGVQILDTYADGTLTATYMNMNGTWTDVTGRINFTRPEGVGPFKNAVWISNPVVSELHVFQDVAYNNLTSSTDSTPDDFKTKYTWVGEDLFDNYWAPHQSRLIVIQGTRDIIQPWADTSALDVLKSGTITFQTRLFNDAKVTVEIANNTVEDTWSYATELKQVQLTESGDSYIYNTILGENQIFQPDQFGVEVFIKPRS